MEVVLNNYCFINRQLKLVRHLFVCINGNDSYLFIFLMTYFSVGGSNYFVCLQLWWNNSLVCQLTYIIIFIPRQTPNQRISSGFRFLDFFLVSPRSWNNLLYIPEYSPVLAAMYLVIRSLERFELSHLSGVERNVLIYLE